MSRKKQKLKNKANGKNETRRMEKNPSLKPETKKGILVVFVFAVAAICLLSLFELTGEAGRYIVAALQMLFGWGKWVFPFILIIIGYLLINEEKLGVKTSNYLGMFLFILSYSGLLHLAFLDEDVKLVIFNGRGGGYLGLCLSYPLYQMLGVWGALVILIAIFIISLLITFENAIKRIIAPVNFLKEVGGKINGRFKSEPGLAARENDFQNRETDEAEYEIKKKGWFKPKETKGAGRAKKDASGEEGESLESAQKDKTERINYQSLPLNLLDGIHTKPAAGDIKTNRLIIQKTLENFGIPVEMGEVSVGPTVTQYTFKPAEGIKLSRVTALSNDLSMALAAHPIRIEAPIPGKSLVGIEVPNQTVAIVSLREVLDSEEFKDRKSSLTIALGKDVAGKAWMADLGKMPHMLVAGSTGSGKTICLNSVIVSLLYQNSPAELKLILIDPKRVEMTLYNNIPHLITPVITDTKKTVNALRWAVGEMDRRFEVLSQAGKRDIYDYNKARKKEGVDLMPYIVIVIDELADLMTSVGAEVEAVIVRLAQMARAVGIHLVMATQRPSVDVITGLIKANITSRVAFSVASNTDSRTILDFSGAEKLLGRGDMLFIAPWVSKPKRIQGVYISTKEIEDITNFLKNEAEPDYMEEVTQIKSNASFSDFGNMDGDELLPDAKEAILQAGRASASLLQRRLKIGYARAARILDLLEEEGFIGPVNGAKPREILRQPSDNYSEPAENFEEEDEEEADEEEF